MAQHLRACYIPVHQHKDSPTWVPSNSVHNCLRHHTLITSLWGNDSSPGCQSCLELLSCYLLTGGKLAKAHNSVVGLTLFTYHQKWQTPDMQLLCQVWRFLRIDLDK